MKQQPNILFVFADQWRAQAFGYAGDPNVKTPNIDRLAQESVNFDNAVSGCPVCTPYRASLMTSVYPNRHKLMVNDQCLAERYEGPFLAECLNDGGFQRFKGYQCYNGFYQDVCFYDEDDQEHRYDYHRTEVTA